jgi:hypothetical protein
MSMDDWMSRQADALAAAAALPRGDLELSDDEIDTVLDIAAIAAHEGGVRTNAPLLCYLVGLAHRSGKTLDELAGVVRSNS